MHWSRWGDPAQAGPLSESAFALVDAFIGTSETPAVDPASVRLSAVLGQQLLDELAGIVGAEHVLTDHETRLHRTRGKSTPDMLKLRAGDGTDSPDAVVRPGDPRRGRGPDRLGGRAPRRAGPVRRRYVGRGRSRRPA